MPDHSLQDTDGRHVLILTPEWPSEAHPNRVPFLVRQVELLQRGPTKLELFHFQTRRNPLNYIKGWIRLNRLLQKHQIDIIHAHFGQSAVIALFARIPLVITFHGSDLMGIPDASGQYQFRGKILVWLSRLISRRARKVICVSESIAKRLPAGVPYSIIPCGVNLKHYRPLSKENARNILGLKQDKKIIFFPANPKRPVKNYQLALDSVKATRRTDIQLIPAENIPYAQMVHYYNASDLVLITSFHEGSPTVIKEALACNCITISTKVGDVEERFGGTIGTAIVPYDSTIIAAKINEFLEISIKPNGRERISLISEEKINKRLVDFYCAI